MALQQTPPTFTAVTTGSEEYSVQLNDANLESKSWKSSRYEGSQTVTKTLNKFTEGDTTYGKTTAVQKYSRNIYIGVGVIGMDSSPVQEDDSLTNFPNFSYAQSNKFITVNSDNTVEVTEIEGNLSSPNAKKGFYRSFHEDFPPGSTCKIILLDESQKHNLQEFYTIYFCEGKLQQLLRFDYGGVGYDAYYNTSSNDFQYADQGGLISASVEILNRDTLIPEFFSGSLIDNIVGYLTIEGDNVDVGDGK